MTKIENIIAEIANWNGAFDKLVKNFTCEDYGLLLDEGRWDGAEEYADEFYQDGDWAAMLHLFIAVWLMDSINMGDSTDTPNLFRLWHESMCD